MIRSRTKKVLYVAPEVSSNQLIADYDNITRIHALDRIFPAIYQLNPDLIIFDHDYLSRDMERIVRRLRTNDFYSRLKICCYKIEADNVTDGLLKAIGVDYFIYADELHEAQKSNNISSLFTQIVDRSMVALLLNALSQA